MTAEEPTQDQAKALVPEDTDIRSLMRALCDEADALHRIHGPQFSVPGRMVRDRVLSLPQEDRARVVLDAYRTLVVLGLPKLLIPDGRTLADYPESCSWRHGKPRSREPGEDDGEWPPGPNHAHLPLMEPVPEQQTVPGTG